MNDHHVQAAREGRTKPGTVRKPVSAAEKKRKRKAARIARARTFNWPRKGV
jgi:hypothetical protein